MMLRRMARSCCLLEGVAVERERQSILLSLVQGGHPSRRWTAAAARVWSPAGLEEAFDAWVLWEVPGGSPEAREGVASKQKREAKEEVGGSGVRACLEEAASKPTEVESAEPVSEELAEPLAWRAASILATVWEAEWPLERAQSRCWRKGRIPRAAAQSLLQTTTTTRVARPSPSQDEAAAAASSQFEECLPPGELW